MFQKAMSMAVPNGALDGQHYSDTLQAGTSQFQGYGSPTETYQFVSHIYYSYKTMNMHDCIQN